MKNKLILILLFFLIYTLLSNTVSADTQVEYSSGSRWGYLEDFGNGYMGTKNFTYKIDNQFNNTCLNDYDFTNTEIEYIICGIELWGINLSTIPTFANPTVTIKRVSLADPNALGVVPAKTHIKDSVTNHVTSAEVQLSTKKWPYNPTKAPMVVAHEFGHVVGLAHVSLSDQIMYGEPLDGAKITEFDIRGMKAMTHSCNPDGEGHILILNGSKETCRVCGASGNPNCVHYANSNGYTWKNDSYHSFQCKDCGNMIEEKHNNMNACDKCLLIISESSVVPLESNPKTNLTEDITCTTISTIEYTTTPNGEITDLSIPTSFSIDRTRTLPPKTGDNIGNILMIFGLLGISAVEFIISKKKFNIK